MKPLNEPGNFRFWSQKELHDKVQELYIQSNAGKNNNGHVLQILLGRQFSYGKSNRAPNPVWVDITFVIPLFTGNRHMRSYWVT